MRCRCRGLLLHLITLSDTHTHTHTHTHTQTQTDTHTKHSVGFPWKSDQPEAETSIRTAHNIHKKKISMSLRDSEPQSLQANGRRPTL